MNNAWICNERKNLINKLEQEFLCNTAKIYNFVGKKGTGKKYILNELENSIKNKYITFQVIADSIMKKNSKHSSHTYEFAFSLQAIIGLSLATSRTTNTKIDYIIKCLQTSRIRKNLLITATDYDLLSSEAREFISVLIMNKDYIQKKTKKNITIIITSDQDYFFGKFEVVRVEFKDYTKEDIYNYLIHFLSYSTNELNDVIIDQIYMLCGTNLNLVNSYADYIIANDKKKVSINAIIDLKLNYYITAGYKYNLSSEMLRNILSISSESINYFNTRLIGFINNEEITLVEQCFQCAEDNMFIKKENISSVFTQSYFFVSTDEKKYLSKNILVNKQHVLLRYYTYISKFYEDEYFERAQYIYKYTNFIGMECFTLIILSISKGFMLNDQLYLNQITTFFNTYNKNESFNKLFTLIYDAYLKHYEMKYAESYDILERTNSFSNCNVLIAEIKRLKFKNLQLGHLLAKYKINELAEHLEILIEKEFVILKNAMIEEKEEKLLSLRIIFDIAPFYLDTCNQKEKFEQLYDRSLIIREYIEKNMIKRSYADFIINIFNRKAFLFVPPSIAMLYYEQAEAYFKECKISTELAITLASKAGMNIALDNYPDAIRDCKKALKMINTDNLKIEQTEKIKNNLYIAQFLEFELKTNSTQNNFSYAERTIKKLKLLLSKESNGKNHVILTNIASLYLYINNDSSYLHTKLEIEKSLSCKDVSDTYNDSINDFYRYHFAWYEFYRYLKMEDWTKCTQLIISLDGFQPAIFHDNKLTELRIKAAKNLVNNKVVPPVKEYCIHFLENASDDQYYSSRGLLLSDLQFTS